MKRAPEIDAGSLRHLITIRRNVGTQDASGQPVPDYTSAGSRVAEVWAEILSTGGTEHTRDQATVAEADTRVKIRYRSDVTPEMRIEHGTRLLNIVSAIDPTGRRISLIIQCKESR